MACSFTSKKRIRKNFGKLKQVASIPNLIEVQKESYDSFLQRDVPFDKRVNKGMQEVFNSIFPIKDPSGTSTLEFIKYELGDEGYRSGNYSAPLKVLLRLIVWDIDEESGIKEIKGIKEQEVYMGDIPIMNAHGTFGINDTEKVIVSQMHRSPGVFFDHDKGKYHTAGKYLYSARIIPYRGSWLDLEFDGKDIIYFRIDRKRKLYVSTLLRALGMGTKEILETYYKVLSYHKKGDSWVTEFVAENMKGVRLTKDLVNADTGDIVLTSGTKITPRIGKKLKEDGLVSIIVDSEQLVGKFLAHDMVNEDSGEIYLKAGHELTIENVNFICGLDIKNVNVLSIDNVHVGSYIVSTMNADRNLTPEDALIEIYRVLRPGEPPQAEAAKNLFYNTFFEKERYDLSVVGRVKMNTRLNLNISEDITVLTKSDIVEILRNLVLLRDGIGEIDDIDHLGNRRVRSVGELLENQFRIGLVRLERSILERMNAVEADSVMPHDLVNSKLLSSVIRDFFTTSQLSQFMDQTNPLSEITHKRRLSALGPGGLTRERASFEVRDVHHTHYGRICPIETPEGQNIGLINSLATFARVNKYGFIESPYRRVTDSIVTDEVIYLSAMQEQKYTIAQANAKVDINGRLIDDLVSSRQKGEFIMAKPEDIEYIDVSPMQLVSVAASLIPFLENDDANRALMGSNMQRQAVPLLSNEAPLVGTGMEAVVARDSGAVVIAKSHGIVEQVDATRIVLKSTDDSNLISPGVEIYNLQKYKRSNHNTCINQRPLVKVGDVINKGDVIADGPSTDLGELALGRNILVGFLSWNGYNFEDSILISERIVKDDVFTSVHIEEFEVVARDTRLGPEEITRDIPNIGEENLRHIDEVGIVHIGAEVRSGDILVGKVTPKSESPMTPEEKLLRAIFGEKAAEVRDSSLHVPPGVAGTVVDVQIFTRRGVEKDERAIAIERAKVEKLAQDRDDELTIIESVIYSRLKKILIDKVVVSGPKGLKVGTKLDEVILSDYTKGQWWQIIIEDEKLMQELSVLHNKLIDIKQNLDKKFQREVDKLQMGDDLPQGALKIVKVFVAMKHKLQPGDKMAGRHGNKGVISRILPVEDMPYLEDGTVLDIVLNPLGLPSRMNVGQILETHLGWASVNIAKQLVEIFNCYKNGSARIIDLKKKLKDIYGVEEISNDIDELSDDEIIELTSNLSKGIPFATPVFDGVKESDINRMLLEAGLDQSGQVRLIDGCTGEFFDRKVTVGYKYMLKLHHLVDDKIHARSIGPYSLVTQQPLGGKSHFGGQRLGEMECWALQAYGAAYTLQEMLTVKSDDVTGRIRIYESIIRGDQNFECGIPESFHVMIKELRSLCLNFELQQSE